MPGEAIREAHRHNQEPLHDPNHNSEHSPAASQRRWSVGQDAPEMQLEACAVVQPVGRKAFLLLAESYGEHAIGAGAHIHPDQPSHFLLPALNTNSLCSAPDACTHTACQGGIQTLCMPHPYAYAQTSWEPSTAYHIRANFDCSTGQTRLSSDSCKQSLLKNP